MTPTLNLWLFVFPMGLASIRPSFLSNSARTLVRLSIIDADDFTFRGTNPFDNFINLTDLRLVPLMYDLWSLLSTAKFKLLHFTTDVAEDEDYPSTEEILALFSSPCFQRLQSLTLNHKNISHHSREYWRLSEEIVSVITRHLRYLHSLEFCMAMDISWCSAFVHLTNLKTLRWGIQEDFEGRPLLKRVGECNWEESSAKVVEEFQRIFANFEQKPRVVIDFDSEFDEKYYGSEINQLARNLESRNEGDQTLRSPYHLSNN